MIPSNEFQGAFELLQVFAYVLLAVLALIQWRRQRGPAAVWICVALAVLAVFFVADYFWGLLDDGSQGGAADIPVALLPLFPYALYRFRSTFVPPIERLRVIAPVATAVIGVVALFPRPAAADPLWVQVWLACFLLHWIGLSGIVVVDLWRAGRGQPLIARRRMRTLSLGAAALAIAAVVQGELSDAGWAGLIVQVLALAAAPLMLAGFVPPYGLRRFWRRREGQELRKTELSLMEATTTGEVAETLLQASCGLLGGVGAQLETLDGEVIASLGATPVNAGGEPSNGSSSAAPMLEVPMRSHRLTTYVNEFTPFFGQEEVSRLQALASLADIALERNALFDEQRLLARVVETSSDAIITKTLDGTITSWNRGAEQLYGYGADEVVGKSITLLLPEGIEDVSQILEQVRAGQPVNNYETKRRTKDGRVVHVSLSVSPLVDASGEIIGASASARDVTEAVVLRAQQEATQEALRQAHLAAERANVSKTEFLSRVSHELRTPLNAILGFAQLLELDELTEEQRDSTDQILKGGRRLLELINDVLDISRIESGRMRLSVEPVPVAAVVQDALQLIRPMAESRQILLETEFADEGVHVEADQQRLGQALLNLLSNAVKYNSEGGSVRITAETLEGDRVRIGVRDTGPGIPEDKIALLYTPFERLGAEQSRVEGVGLGLALTRSLVDAMGGSLELETRPGEGTTFWIQLRKAEADVRDAEEPSSERDHHYALTGTVLYIEDNLSNLTLVQRLVSSRTKVSLLTAVTGGEGLDLAREHRPDVILLDVHLPDLQGGEVLARLRSDEETASIPVIILSADATTGQIDRLLGAGAAGYLTKPIDVAGFFRVLEGFLSPSPSLVSGDG